MVKTRLAQVAFKPERKVTKLCLSLDGSYLAWAEQGGHLSLIDLNLDEAALAPRSWKAEGSIVGLCNRGQRFFALDDINGLSCLDMDGTVAWSVEVLGGGHSLYCGPHDMAIIDSLGRLYRVDYTGKTTNLTTRFEHISKAVFVNEHLVLAHEDGTVQALADTTTTWIRDTRGEVGEAITALGVNGSGHLVIGREGYALVDGEEEALEMETWCLNGKGLLHRSDLKTRLTHCTESANGIICGFDDGRVTSYVDGRHEDVLNTSYAIQNLLVRGEQVVATSWFYIFGKTKEGATWKMEHQGIPSLLVGSIDGSRCFFAGEDQNDWTDPEPIGSFSMNDALEDVDPSELNAWFQKDVNEPARSAEEIYRVDESVEVLLTEEERELMRQPADVSMDFLHDALADDVEPSMDEGSVLGTLNVDAEALLEAMDDELSQMAMMPDEDLFDALNEQVVAPIQPLAKAGDDREVVCDEDGTSVVVLDGSGSEDPQHRIVMWSWVDSTGKEIATQSRVKVRLSEGVHRFELRICDREGQWSSDALQVTLSRA